MAAERPAGLLLLLLLIRTALEVPALFVYGAHTRGGSVAGAKSLRDLAAKEVERAVWQRLRAVGNGLLVADVILFVAADKDVLLLLGCVGLCKGGVALLLLSCHHHGLLAPSGRFAQRGLAFPQPEP